MSTKLDKELVNELLEALNVPESAYEKAESRYKDLGKWFERQDSKCSGYSPHIYPQGSFRLGTVIRPIGKEGDYDLDLGCRLREGVKKSTHSQRDLKNLVGNDLEEYRNARGIQHRLEAKHRCWRLQYADELNFHMDVVPSIPQDDRGRGLLKESMVRNGLQADLAGTVSAHAGAITDDRSPSYNFVSAEWLISNSEGYALWFESRIRLAQPILEKRAKARIDDLKPWKWKSPLQQVVQLLKWHRDTMFQTGKRNPDSKPISVILTTLAAHAYQGEEDVEVALQNILTRMGDFVRPIKPRVPNPINPEEDFADRWYNPDCSQLNLEQNFRDWLERARRDFHTIGTTDDPVLLEKTAKESFGVNLPKRLVTLQLRTPKGVSLLDKVEQLKTGARTSTAGIIGGSGIVNRPHGFYGEE
jgi:hypothetical protein